ncbi:NTPase KAP family P-loop domain-containing protein 1 [Pristis pectinata]|uniref:NTPase KAP family P-loop domain-containing protein 1 n=1 Tax=Pristis pectinata TaxID=685728 RepID=UPI00223E0E1A|nr:NTPase KAP family P-loop domain-containing protein 1 [Pristis pectinata]
MSRDECNGQTLYDSYATCLARALCYVPTPMTVGLYAPWGSGINCLLQNIEKQIKIEALDREKKELKRLQEKPRVATGFGFILLLWYLVFLKPQITEQHEKRKNVRFIFIQFSAWQFAGSDKLWAGLITTLCDDIKNQFGCIPTSIVRALGHQDTVQRTNSNSEWVSKTILGIPVWLIFTSLLFLAIVLACIVSVYGFTLSEMGNNYVAAAEGVGFGLIGISALMTIKNSIMVGKNMVVSQKEKMKTLMNKSDFSSQLGFMNDVKQEVKVLTNFIHYMAVFERRKIRIVLKIMSLDRCTPDKIVGVLDAMNILLSDPDAPFISILAVDPSIIVACVEKSNSLKGIAENGYEFLNRIVSLPFSVPQMDTQTKLKYLQRIVDGKNFLMEENPPPKQDFGRVNRFQKHFPESSPLITVSTESNQPSMQRNGKLTPGYYIQQAYQCLTDMDGDLHEYVEENFLLMRRIVNIISVMIGLMMERNFQMSSFPPQKIVAWVILASNWPCRLSWIWQCWEDAEQRSELNEEKEIDDKMLLWTIYENSSEKFNTIKSSIEKLLELDGDPEIFQKFLSISYKFTVKEGQSIIPFTINLDQSLKRKMEVLLARKL